MGSAACVLPYDLRHFRDILVSQPTGNVVDLPSEMIIKEILLSEQICKDYNCTCGD